MGWSEVVWWDVFVGGWRGVERGGVGWGGVRLEGLSWAGLGVLILVCGCLLLLLLLALLSPLGGLW